MIDWLTALLLLTGFVAGFVNAIAGGGSLLTVPAFVLAGLDPAVAVATNRFAITFMAVAGLVRYRRAGLVRVRLAGSQALAALIGSVLGARLVLELDPEALKRALALCVLAMTWVALRSPRPEAPAARADSPPRRVPRLVSYGLLPLVLGIYGGFYGAGVSTLFILADVILERTSFLEAAATTQLVLAVLSAAAAVTFALHGAILWRLGLPLAATMAAGGWLGAHAAIRGGDRLVRGVLGVVVVLMALALVVG